MTKELKKIRTTTLNNIIIPIMFIVMLIRISALCLDGVIVLLPVAVLSILPIRHLIRNVNDFIPLVQEPRMDIKKRYNTIEYNGRIYRLQQFPGPCSACYGYQIGFHYVEKPLNYIGLCNYTWIFRRIDTGAQIRVTYNNVVYYVDEMGKTYFVKDFDFEQSIGKIYTEYDIYEQPQDFCDDYPQYRDEIMHG